MFPTRASQPLPKQHPCVPEAEDGKLSLGQPDISKNLRGSSDLLAQDGQRLTLVPRLPAVTRLSEPSTGLT